MDANDTLSRFQHKLFPAAIVLLAVEFDLGSLIRVESYVLDPSCDCVVADPDASDVLVFWKF